MPDMQAGHEKTLTAILPILAGANMIYGPGMLENGLIMSLGQLVADADFIRMFKMVTEGVAVDEESMALDVIHRVGIGGNYLSDRHTAKLYKTKQSLPRVMDRHNRGDWEQLGAMDMSAKAAAEARKILGKHQPQVLDEATANKIRQMVIEADRELAKKEPSSKRSAA